MMTATEAIRLWRSYTGVVLSKEQQDKLENLMNEIHKAGYCIGYTEGQSGDVHRYPDTKTIMDESAEQGYCPGCGVEEGAGHRDWCRYHNGNA